jgi:hypothetical protein
MGTMHHSQHHAVPNQLRPPSSASPLGSVARWPKPCVGLRSGDPTRIIIIVPPCQPLTHRRIDAATHRLPIKVNGSSICQIHLWPISVRSKHDHGYGSDRAVPSVLPALPFP